MKLVYTLYLSVCLSPAVSFAQDLAVNSTSRTSARGLLCANEAGPDAGDWQKQQDQVYGHISSSRLTRMKNLTDAIISYFHHSCITEESLTPAWHGEYFSDGRGSGMDMKFSVQCDFSDQKAKLAVLANDIRPLLLKPLIVNNQEFLAIRPSTGADQDHPYFEFSSYSAEANADEPADGGSLQNRVWLVAKGQLPYIPVTRSEYLKEARMELVTRKQAIIDDMKKNMPVRALEVQEADKQAALDQLATIYSGTELKVRTRMFLSNYNTDEQYQKENIDKETSGLDSTIALMDRLLGHSTAADLRKPAILSVRAADFDGFEDGRPGSKLLVRINPAFVAAATASDTPGFVLVRWQYDLSEPMAGALDLQMREGFDARRLEEAMHN